MSRRCMVTGKGVQAGNNVSHAHNKSRRRFLPNVHDTKVFSEVLGRNIKLRVSNAGLRTLDHKGGLDAWLISTPASKLNACLRKVKDQVVKALASKKA